MKKRIIFIGLVVVIVGLVIYSLIGTFASDSTVASNNNIYEITLTGSSGEIVVPAGSSKTVIYQITNTNKGVVKYGVAYAGDNITVKVYNDTIDEVTGLMDYGENKFVKLYIENSGTTNSTASIKAILGYENGGELDIIVPEGYTLVTREYRILKGAAFYITNLFLNNLDETTIVNNNISYKSASSVGLINDRQGTMKVHVDDGNIRYYGANPNNYVYFNCSDYSNQSANTCEVWRIIGVFDGKVKIIRNELIDSLAWDLDKNINSNLITYSNNWEESSLQLMLNSSYYNGNMSGTITYYSGENGEDITILDMEKIGIKNDKTRNLISKSLWYLGGYSSLSGLYANDIYIHERTESTSTIYGTNPPLLEENIGLMYGSDYGYATDLSICTTDLYNYDVSICYSNNWLYTGNYMWTISQATTAFSDVWRVSSSGYYRHFNGVYLERGVYPTLYLVPDVFFAKGDGSQDNPFQLLVE